MFRSVAVDVLCRRDGATVYLGAFPVRSESVASRGRRPDGPEPGRGQGLGAPWTPAPRTRCERPGREYQSRVPSAEALVPMLRTTPPRGLFRSPRAHPRLRNVPCAFRGPRSPLYSRRSERRSRGATFSRPECVVTASVALRHFETLASVLRPPPRPRSEERGHGAAGLIAIGRRGNRA